MSDYQSVSSHSKTSIRVDEDYQFDEEYYKSVRVMALRNSRYSLKNNPEEFYPTITLKKIIELVKKPLQLDKSKAPAIIGSTYCRYDARKHEVQQKHGMFFLLRFDIDKGDHSLTEVDTAFSTVLPDNFIIIYSTFSATAQNKRWRVLIPLLSPVTHNLRRAAEVTIRQHVEKIGQILCDPSLDRAGQHVYLPNVNSNPGGSGEESVYYESHLSIKPPLSIQSSCLASEISQYVEKEKYEEALRQEILAEWKQKRGTQSEQMAKLPDGTLSPIDWYNKHQNLEDLLLQVGYEQSPSNPNDWRSPLQTSSSYATRVFDDYFVTLSATDAESGLGFQTQSGNRCGNAFSIFKHFVHGGDIRSALHEIAISRDFVDSQCNQEPNSNPLILIPLSIQELNSASATPRVIVPEFLYADVRTRIAPGGSSKTTVALYEIVTLAMGYAIWGKKPVKPVRSVVITREDSREILAARIREILCQFVFGEEEMIAALENIAIIDLTSQSLRFSSIVQDIVVPNDQNIRRVIDILIEWKPDWIICDPLVSFGVGESRVNDAEQGIIEAFRLLRNDLNCCIEGIHHTGKSVARDKILDQYAGRGGSALADGCRMVAVMQPLSDKEWFKATACHFSQGQSGIVMAFPKLSYCAPQPPVYILRDGYRFRQIEVVGGMGESSEWLDVAAEELHEYLLTEYNLGKHYSASDLDRKAKDFNLTRQELRSVIANLKTMGKVMYHQHRGKAASYYEPLI